MRNHLQTFESLQRPVPAKKNFKEHVGSIQWNRVLIWFMRIMAFVWIAKGVWAWAFLVGHNPYGLAFELRTFAGKAGLIYFAVIDLIAAVGLWLASTWGGVMWLLALMSHMILSAFFPHIVEASLMILGVMGTLVAAYLAVSWMAVREMES